MMVAVVAAGCATAPPPIAPAPEPARMATLPALVAASPEDVGMNPRLGSVLDSVMEAGLAAGAAPGGSLAVGRYGRLVHLRGYGQLASTDRTEVTEHTLYDLASLSKVIATTTSAMILEEQGLLQLDRPVGFYLPRFGNPIVPGAPYDTAKSAITVRMLLTHSGGLEAFAPLYLPEYGSLRGRDAYLAAISDRPLAYVPGTKVIYSDWDFVLMQLVIEKITGTTLDQFAWKHIFEPLGMRETTYLPGPLLLPRVAPTAVDTSRGGLLRGLVHDGNAWAIGGVSGHAGLFSTASDLAIFAQMLLNGGSYNGVRIVRPETLARWTAPQLVGESRALGWDTPSGRSSAGRYFGPRSFGHTGFTGTSIWLDPERGVFVVLLLNRVNLGGDANNNHTALRREVANAVQNGILNAPLRDWGDPRP
jgi:CubicO group peptidase (beta-lactamase class C family)